MSVKDYKKLKIIGQGSFGIAWLVIKKHNNKIKNTNFVIKELNLSKMTPKDQINSRKEVEVLSQLKHPNIVNYIESFEGKQKDSQAN
jgi:NIMA (never in mitosis gene a)-related kinase 1/4/5